MVRYIKNSADFEGLMALSNEKLVVVDFTATWCPPCRMIGPKFEAMAEKYPNAEFVKVDVDEAQDVAEEVGISAMPTFQFYKDGERVDELVGASESKLEALVVKHYS
mmetsp:Transcript_19422/g.27453  ORF Transcript_19422/g.27453 Transcript_19422/m.27453 type:complete len:107 (-) Transcript_19422:269-589(-)